MADTDSANKNDSASSSPTITLEEATIRSSIQSELEGIEHQPVPELQAGSALLNKYGYDFLYSLVYRHRPLLYLHHDEQYRPCSVHYYLQHADLYLGNKRIIVKEGTTLNSELIGDVRWLETHKQHANEVNTGTSVISTATFSFAYPPSSAAEDSKAARYAQTFNMRLRPEHRGGFSKEKINEAPVYAYVRDRHEEYWELVYIFHYAYNGPYKSDLQLTSTTM